MCASNAFGTSQLDKAGDSISNAFFKSKLCRTVALCSMDNLYIFDFCQGKINKFKMNIFYNLDANKIII